MSFRQSGVTRNPYRLRKATPSGFLPALELCRWDSSLHSERNVGLVIHNRRTFSASYSDAPLSPVIPMTGGKRNPYNLHKMSPSAFLAALGKTCGACYPLPPHLFSQLLRRPTLSCHSDDRREEESLQPSQSVTVGIPRCTRKDMWGLLSIIAAPFQTVAPTERSDEESLPPSLSNTIGIPSCTRVVPLGFLAALGKTCGIG